MTISESEYFAKRQRQIQRRQKMLTIVSVALFLGPVVFTVIPAINSKKITPQQESTSVTTLQQQIQEYEQVLQRDPNNQQALEQLFLLRLRQQDRKGAIVILEKLVTLYPDKQEYKLVLEQEKLKIQQVNSK